MSQVTNLNVSPYFDDFDANNDYYKVLFKPGYPIQARELTTLQTILQNQVEKFGQHFFKEGAKVIPGNTTYNQFYYAVELNNTYLGVPLDAYVDQLIGSKITGQTSGITAIVEKVLLSSDSERGNVTLYVNYLSSSTQNNSTVQFLDGENLYSNITITSGLLGNTSITAGTPFGITIASNATSIGSAFSITEGVYFIRGYFVKVNTETLILDQYSNNPNYRVGLFVSEEVVNSDIDETLNDNSQGFNNYASPGADRLKISASLFKKNLTDFNDNNFVELATIVGGVIKTNRTTKDYNLIEDELARRTYAESGDYYITPFDLSIKESLDDKLGNRGIFNQGQFTYGGSTPSENLAIYQVSPGKAFVRGYEVETVSPIFLDAEKPRSTATLNNLSINYNTGSTLSLNRVYGSPTIGIGNTYILSLRDSRVGIASTTPSGKEIGVARVYDFRLESGSYDSTNSNLNQWNISLYDVQTTTEITLNEPITLNVPTFIKGKNSGATAFLKNSITNSTSIVLYQKNGDFVPFESFIIDGVSNSRVAIAITSYSISDVKSVYGIVGSAKTFNADTVQTDLFTVGIATISASSGGVSTVTSTNENFPGKIVKVGNLIKFSNGSSYFPAYARVVSVGKTTIGISSIASVTGINQGDLPTSTLNVSDLKIITTRQSSSSDDTLYTVLPRPNIASVDLTNASLTIRKTFNVTIADNQSSIITAGENETFLPFDEERYSLIRSDGSVEILTSDKLDFLVGSTQLKIYGLGSNDNATLVATLRKIKPKSKIKLKNKISSLLVDKSKYEGSGIGQTTLNDGLTYGNYPYGTRVQDENISLNIPDIINVYGIYESKTTADPSAPTLVLSSISGPTAKTSDLIIGEQFIGQLSGAIGIYAERLTDSQISFISLNENNFKEGETLTFLESNISASIVSINASSLNISSNFKFDNGQKGSFYGHGTINRLPSSPEPSKKLKVYFASGYYQSSDDGDITTLESYRSFDYKKDIQIVNSIRNSDMIDIRPRVSSYTVVQDSPSPLEFYGRKFDGSGNSATNILASDESIVTTFSYYLGRIDRIYIRKDGTFQVKYGVPSEKPEKPISVDDALEIATVTLPPYLFDISQASVQFLEHKRYRMVDIKQLENRIKNLEYHTALSMLESSTANLFVPDTNGLDRFKSGFFVDNFSSLNSQESGLPFENSIDLKNKELRPKHYTTAIDLIQGPVEGVDPLTDLSFEVPEGNNIRKTGDLITLDYSEVEWLKQSFATRTENVTPFVISFWQGTLELTPATDTWVDTVRLDAKINNVEGNYSQTMALAQKQFSVDPQTGYSPTVWGAWETNWTGREVIETVKLSTDTTYNDNYNYNYWRGWPYGGYGYWGYHGYWGWNRGSTTTTVTQDTYREVKETGVKSRTGTTTFVTEQFDRQSVGDKVVSRDLVQYLRSRNIQFIAKNIKPLTQLYAFFDGVDVTKYCTPKLLEISMISGVFQVGETVIGTSRATGLGENWQQSRPKITFRVAQANHKQGPYNGPTSTYSLNPYTSQTLPSTYSSTSSVLNIDTFSLCAQYQGEFGGWVESGMTLIGKTSGAQATITNLRLVSDVYTSLIGSFYIPNPTVSINPRFESGSKIFTLINNTINNKDLASTVAEEKFISSGILETVQENIISTRNARIEQKQNIQKENVSKTTGTQLVGSNVVSSTTNWYRCPWWDPLAQSFLVQDESGIFLTRCDIFFKSKDDTDIPVLLQIRTMQGGYPTQTIIPFSEIILDPDRVNISNDGSVATSFIFKSPVYLEGGKEYAIIVGSNSNKYNVFISRVGEVDLLTQSYISNQPYLGSLFKSQNASTWEASQWEDLKFTLYRADFLNSGSVEFYSPELSEGNSQIPTLLPNALNLTSRRIRIGISSGLSDSNLTLGNTILQQGTSASGNYVGNAGIATGALQVINAGIGYTPSAGIATYANIDLISVTGNGRNAKANVTISNGVAIAATVVTSGNGYQVGDVLGISTLGLVSVGRNALFSLVSIASTNELVLDNVQGNFAIAGTGKTVQYINNSGLTTNLNYSSGGNVQISDINVDSDGLHIVVNHKNHGMYSDDNFVRISGVESDISPTKLTSGYNFDSVGSILIEDSSNFATFENVGVGTTNPGYALVGSTLVQYESISANSLDNVTRLGYIEPITSALIPSVAISYGTGVPVYKYELGGVSLRRINTYHYIGDVTVADPISFDSYNIKIQMDMNGTDRTDETSFPRLYLNQAKSSGGFNIKATQNIPFEIITPLVQNITVQGTTINSEIRTTTGSSISGDEIAFIDSGFEPIALNKSNYFANPKIIASKINEDEKLGSLVGKKSMNLRMFLNSVDSRVSPVIDTQRVSAILTSNRVNKVITDYAIDNRVNTIGTDPSAFQYISKEIGLENPATSIKILLDAHINNYCDIRAFYAIGENQNFVPIFTPFPGYNNLDFKKQIINFEDSDGLPDTFVQPSTSFGFDSGNIDFKEYTFTADQVPSFRFYRIKLVLTSTNQVYPPRIKNLRVIALA